MLYSCAIVILSIQLCPSVQWFDSQQQNGYISSPTSTEFFVVKPILMGYSGFGLCFPISQEQQQQQ